MFDKYFPAGIAEGDAFLGRKEEIRRLTYNIQNGQHTLLLAPRRYGKTSLARNVIATVDIPGVEIDLFVAQNEMSMEHKFIKGVQSLLAKIDAPETWIRSLVNYFKRANKTWTVGFKGANLELTPDNYRSVPDNILESLNALEYVLHDKGIKVVMFIDEFQEITRIKNHRAIEGAIRHFAQSSKHVLFIFSGSHRHTLQHMFEDESRPLYSLCDHICLDRLSEADYGQYLKKISKKTWNCEISDASLQRIFTLTKCHPRYVYAFCFRLWDHCFNFKTAPDAEDINEVWNKFVESKLKDFQEKLDARPTSQVKLMAFIALGNQELTSQYSQSVLGISGSAISQALKILQQSDLIERSPKGHYRIVDPILHEVLVINGPDYFANIRGH